MLTLTDSPPARSFVVHSDLFTDVLGDHAALHKVLDVDAHEGPVYVASEEALYFTTVPRRAKSAPERPIVAIKRVALDGDRFPVDPSSVTTVIPDANSANGMALDADGTLLVCEQGSFEAKARIGRVDLTTRIATSLVDHWVGSPLNSPNDVAIAPDGAVWFTDPSYGSLQGFRPEPDVGDFVYRLDRASGRLDVVAVGFDKPNGLAFSPDGSILYIGDSGAIQAPESFHAGRPHHVLAYDVVGGRRLANERLFAAIAPGFPDGIKTDADGRVYISSASGVQVFAADGEPLGEIAVPGSVNFCFGGPERNVLFITCDTAVWAAVLNTKGA